MSYDYSRSGAGKAYPTPTKTTFSRRQLVQQKRNFRGRSATSGPADQPPILPEPHGSLYSQQETGISKRSTSKRKQVKSLLKKGQSASKTGLRGAELASDLALSPGMLSPSSNGLKKLLKRMGGIFELFGQYLSRVLPSDKYQIDLAECLGETPPLSTQQFERTLNKQLKEAKLQHVEVLSIGAPVRNGAVAEVRKARVSIKGKEEDVLIKVLKPGIQEQLKRDRQIIQTLMKLGKLVLPTLKNPHVARAIDGFWQKMETEADFQTEARNTQEVAEFLDRQPDAFPGVDVCRLLPESIGPGVLIMKDISGTPLTSKDFDERESATANVSGCLRRCMEDTGMFYDLPAPENLLMASDGKVYLTDLNHSSQVSSDERKAFALLARGVRTRKKAVIAQALADLGHKTLDKDQLDELAEAVRSNMGSMDYNLFNLIKAANRAGIEYPDHILPMLQQLLYSRAFTQELAYTPEETELSKQLEDLEVFNAIEILGKLPKSTLDNPKECRGIYNAVCPIWSKYHLFSTPSEGDPRHSDEAALIALLKDNPTLCCNMIGYAIAETNYKFINWFADLPKASRIDVAEIEKRAERVLTMEYPQHEQDFFMRAAVNNLHLQKPLSESFPYDHQVVIGNTGRKGDDDSLLILHRKNERRSACYDWNLKENKLNCVGGEVRPWTGKYKMVLMGHGDGFNFYVNTGNEDKANYRPLTPRSLARKIKTMVDENGGVAPAKLTVFSCYSGTRGPIGPSFASRLIRALHKEGIDTVVSAPIGTVRLTESGRKVVEKKDWRMKKTAVTRDPSVKKIFKKKNYKLDTSNSKWVYWYHNGILNRTRQ